MSAYLKSGLIPRGIFVDRSLYISKLNLKVRLTALDIQGKCSSQQ